jgi:hypoxanthine-guanine phosphoribosyltransferase
MDSFKAYCDKICEEEVEVLKGYENFLSIFYNNLTKDAPLDHYCLMESDWRRRLGNIRKVMKGLAIEPSGKERDILLVKSGNTLKNIINSLDRIKGSLHDEIGSLNQKNSRMGLRYNRYDNRTAKPGLIDITT